MLPPQPTSGLTLLILMTRLDRCQASCYFLSVSCALILDQLLETPCIHTPCTHPSSAGCPGWSREPETTLKPQVMDNGTFLVAWEKACQEAFHCQLFLLHLSSAKCSCHPPLCCLLDPGCAPNLASSAGAHLSWITESRPRIVLCFLFSPPPEANPAEEEMPLQVELAAH